MLDPAIYREAAFRLDRHFAISIIDCGSTMDAPVTQEVLRDLDALIVVSSPWADGASAAAKTMDWLADHNLRGLLQRTIVVLNDSDGHADKRTRSLLAREFINHGQPVVEVPFDPHLRPGGVIDVSTEMAPATRLRFLQVAATVAGYFAARPAEMRNRPPRASQPVSAARFSPVLSISRDERISDPASELASHARGPVTMNSSVVPHPIRRLIDGWTASKERPGCLATQVNVRMGSSSVTVQTSGRRLG